MIDGSKWWGKAMLIFFWGGFAASLVNMAYAFHPFSPYAIAWSVVLVNMIIVLLKNKLIPPTK